MLAIGDAGMAGNMWKLYGRFAACYRSGLYGRLLVDQIIELTCWDGWFEQKFKIVISRSMLDACSELCSPFLKGGNSAFTATYIGYDKTPSTADYTRLMIGSSVKKTVTGLATFKSLLNTKPCN